MKKYADKILIAILSIGTLSILTLGIMALVALKDIIVPMIGQ